MTLTRQRELAMYRNRNFCDLYGPGTHNWVYFNLELHRAWPMISDGLGLR